MKNSRPHSFCPLFRQNPCTNVCISAHKSLTKIFKKKILFSISFQFLLKHPPISSTQTNGRAISSSSNTHQMDLGKYVRNTKGHSKNTGHTEERRKKTPPLRDDYMQHAYTDTSRIGFFFLKKRHLVNAFDAPTCRTFVFFACFLYSCRRCVITLFEQCKRFEVIGAEGRRVMLLGVALSYIVSAAMVQCKPNDDAICVCYILK